MKRTLVFSIVFGVFVISLFLAGFLFWKTFWVIPEPDMLRYPGGAAEARQLADRLVAVESFKCQNVEFAENYGRGDFFIIGSLRGVVKKEDLLNGGFVQVPGGNAGLPGSVGESARRRYEGIFRDASVYSKSGPDKADPCPYMYLFIDPTSRFFIISKA